MSSRVLFPSSCSNATALAAYIERTLGPRHLPLSTIVPISVVYAVIFVLGVLGNVSTCLVIFRNKYMQTPTNVYLANLAVSDLLTHLVGKQASTFSSTGEIHLHMNCAIGED